MLLQFQGQKPEMGLIGLKSRGLRGVAKMAEKNDPEFISSHGKTKTIIHRAAIDENYP